MCVLWKQHKKTRIEGVSVSFRGDFTLQKLQVTQNYEHTGKFLCF